MHWSRKSNPIPVFWNERVDIHIVFQVVWATRFGITWDWTGAPSSNGIPCKGTALTEQGAHWLYVCRAFVDKKLYIGNLVVQATFRKLLNLNLSSLLWPRHFLNGHHSICKCLSIRSCSWNIAERGIAFSCTCLHIWDGKRLCYPACVDALGAWLRQPALGSMQSELQPYILYKSSTVMYDVIESRAHMYTSQSHGTRVISQDPGSNYARTGSVLLHRRLWAALKG